MPGFKRIGQTASMKVRSALLLSGLTLAMIACAPPGGQAKKDGEEGPGKTEMKLVFDPTKVDKPSGKMEVAIFEGGYKLDFYQATGDKFKEKYPDVEMKLWGNPRVWEQLRARFLANDVPDVTWPGWGMDYWALVYGGQLLDMNDALDLPAYDGSGKWRDTFDAKLLKLGEYKGKQYLLPHHVNVNGWWYSPKLFADNGWTVPKTFEELLALCPQIKAKGIAPITFQGKYPYYMTSGFLYPWIISAGGIESLDAAFNLEPGAWKSPAVLKAAAMVKELAESGFFQEGAMGLSHTESQTEFLNRKAAMIPCGTWLYSEMKEVMPPGADMAFMRIPMLESGKNATAIQAGIEPWVIPYHAKNKEAGIAYFRYLTSVEQSKEFVKSKGTLTAVKGSDDIELPEHLKGAAEALRTSEAIWSADFRLWYPTLGKEVENAMASLLTGKETPESFADRCEKAAEAVRNDAKIPKHKVER